MFFDHLGLKATVSVSRDINLELAFIGYQIFTGVAITAVGDTGSFMLVITKMSIKLGIEGCLNSDFF